MYFDSTTPGNTVWITHPETMINGDSDVPNASGRVHRMTLGCLLRITASGVGDGEELALLALANALDDAGINEWPTEGPAPQVTVEID